MKKLILLALILFVVLISGCTQNVTVPTESTNGSNETMNSTEGKKILENESMVKTYNCSDGTEYNNCSSIKPEYCQDGILINKCSYCGCPSEKECQSNESCTAKKLNPIKIDNGTSAKIYNNIIVFAGQGFSTGTLHGSYVTDIYAYDLSTKKGTKITDSTRQYLHPHIYDKKIVYGGDAFYIYMYDLDTSKKIEIVNNGQWQSDWYINGDIIAWAGHRDRYTQVYIRNLKENTETEITNDNTFKSHVSVSGNRLVWEQTLNGTDNHAIFLYDLSTSKETQVTQNDIDSVYPMIYGDNIIYTGNYRSSDNKNRYDLVVYNLGTGSKIIIESNILSFSGTSIYKNKVIWAECVKDNGKEGVFLNCIGYDIFMYDIDTGKKTQITNDILDQTYPDIYENKIVWTESNTSNVNSIPSIYLYELIQ